MKVLFVNPHRSDFVFNSPVYYLFKRKSLKKYRYLDIFFKQNDTDLYFLTSTLTKYFNLFKILEQLILNIEIQIFNKINDNKIAIKKLDNNKTYGLTFCFGFSIRDLTKNQFKEIVNHSKIVIIHLSHYHIYPNKLNVWSNYDNVVFCADTNITKNYFYNYITNKNTPFFVLSYSIDNNKFKINNPLKNRESKIICTGTFHEFEKMYKTKYLRNSIISGVFGFLTIHPERRMLFYFKDKLKGIVILNSSMGRFNFFHFFKRKNSISQSSYFQFDIVEQYNKYKYVFVGEESIAGLPGIGVFEAILCGCIPIINDFCYDGTPLEKSTIPFKYSNINNLYNLINNFTDYSNKKCYTEDELYSFINEVAEFYSDTNQLQNLKNFIINYR